MLGNDQSQMSGFGLRLRQEKILRLQNGKMSVSHVLSIRISYFGILNVFTLLNLEAHALYKI